MATLTVDIPDNLRATIAEKAKSEGVSMNEYLLFALSRIVAADEISDQKARYERLTKRYSQEEAEAALKNVLESRSPDSK